MDGMTARQLAEALMQLPEEVQNLPVTTEGCDCDGDAGSIEVRFEGYVRDVYIKRAIDTVFIQGLPSYRPPEDLVPEWSPKFIGPKRKPQMWDEFIAAKEAGLLPDGAELTY